MNTVLPVGNQFDCYHTKNECEEEVEYGKLPTLYIPTILLLISAGLFGISIITLVGELILNRCKQEPILPVYQ